MRVTYMQNHNVGVSKNTIVGTLTRTRFLPFLKKYLLIPTSHLCYLFYGNCQERTYIFRKECIPSFPSSEMYVPLGITQKYMAKKGLTKDRDKQQYPYLLAVLFSPYYHLHSLLCLRLYSKRRYEK